MPYHWIFFGSALVCHQFDDGKRSTGRIWIALRLAFIFIFSIILIFSKVYNDELPFV